MYYKNVESPLRQKSKKFAIKIIKLIRELNKDRNLLVISNQILKSGTSIHANIRESEYAQSPADFSSKLSISLKEANETAGWLELLLESECISEDVFVDLNKDCSELIAILISSIRTIKLNNNL